MKETAGVSLSRRARRIEVSPTVAMSQRAAALAAAGERILDLSVGEPDQPTPAHIASAAVAALEAGRTRYTASAGIPELRKAVAERYRQDYGLGFSAPEVVATIGGKHALYTVCQAALGPGDEVVVPTPHWPTFSEAVRLAGARPVSVPLGERDGFRITARVVAKAIGPRTRAVIINTPSNPTGAVISERELLAIGRIARRRRLLVFYDDTYAKIAYGAGSASALPALHRLIPDGLVILGTASKSYCMTGWRIGWLMGPRTLMDACAAIISHSTQCPTAFAQAGAVAALSGPQDLVREMAAEYRKRRDAFLPALTAIAGVTCVRPEGAFYLFPNVSAYLGRSLPTTLDLAARLLDEQGVAVVPGEGFGAPGYLRISFARPLPELVEAAKRIAAFLAGLDPKPARSSGRSR